MYTITYDIKEHINISVNSNTKSDGVCLIYSNFLFFITFFLLFMKFLIIKDIKIIRDVDKEAAKTLIQYFVSVKRNNIYYQLYFIHIMNKII